MPKRFVEVEGKTTKEAIQKALSLLQVSKDDVDIKILREESKGLFGMEGQKLAKVKVIVK